MSKKGWILLACLCLTAVGVIAAARGVVVVKDETGQSISLYGGSHALLIGVSDYAVWPKLENVPGELASVKQLLQAQGFKVVEVSDPNAAELRRAFQDFINDYGRSPDNRLLFFFSGHGHTLKKGYRREMGYIVPADAPRPDQDRNGFLRRAVSMNQVLTWAREIDAKHALFLFDSCFSGTVFKAKNLPKKPPHISRLTAEPVREFITAGSAGETVPAESVFTPAFVDALRYRLGDLDEDGFVTGMELGLHLQAKVPRHTGQTPQYGKIHDYPLSRGDFVFALKRAPPPEPVRFLGNVQVNVNLPARVYIGNEPVGRAAPGKPLNRMRVPAGTTQVRVEAEGHQAQTQTARVRRGKWTQLVFELVPDAPGGIAAPPPVFRDDPQAAEAVLNLTQRQRRRLQQALNARGFAAGSADGVLGPHSRRALAAYQRSEGQAPTGYLTAGQWARLKTASPKQTPPPSSRSALEPEMAAIRGGCFQMGSPSDEKDRYEDERQHRVCVEDFKLGRYEVTQAQWRAVMGNDPSYFKDCDDCPVEQVSWNDVQAFLEKLNTRTGKGYRLATEAEWEYACRGGRTGERYCGGDDADALAWYYGNNGQKTHSVGGKLGNGFGLYDMTGNVWEWTCSAYDKDYGGAETQCVGKNDSGRRVLRGGSWGDVPGLVRAADRYGGGGGPDGWSNGIGFRLAQD